MFLQTTIFVMIIDSLQEPPPPYNPGYGTNSGYSQGYQQGSQHQGYQHQGYQQPGYQQPGYQQPGYPTTGQPGYPAGYMQQPMPSTTTSHVTVVVSMNLLGWCNA